jgi:cytochrome c6
MRLSTGDIGRCRGPARAGLRRLVQAAARSSRAAAWAAALAAAQAAGAAGAADPLAHGRELFTRGAVPACAVCHTLADAGSSGAVGPVLDELRPDADRVTKALRTGIGAMPSYQGQLSEAQIAALAAYVAQASRGGAR